ncbi:MAG: coenzyme F420-0:L-glutamate ligase [Pseudomonadota bacterium]
MNMALHITPLQGFPLVCPGDDLALLINVSLTTNGLALVAGDVLVLAQKIVSKSEDRYVRLGDITPSTDAEALALEADKDPRLVELILRESREVLRVRRGVIIVEHRNGYVHANAGIDRSNIENSEQDPQVLLLPQDADLSAQRLRESLMAKWGAPIAVVINDSFGRAWRNGTVGVAIGCAGLTPLKNQVGEHDLFGNTLEVTEPAVADELAAAASLVMGQAAEGCPVVLVRGMTSVNSAVGSASLIRDPAQDLFR